jgi:hypothetical protein
MKMMDGFGVEYIRSSNDTVRTPDGLDYVNMGDTYDLTLVYDHNKGKYVVTSWGDIVEADMGLPKSREIALGWFRRAAASGHQLAKDKVAELATEK